MNKIERSSLPQKSSRKGSNQSGMRDYNERLLLSLIRREGAMAKADIARTTGLSAQTVTNIMRALEEDGLIVKGEPQRGKVGQPSVPIGLAPDGAFFWGLKVGRRSLEMVLTNFLGDVINRRQQMQLYPTPEATVAFVEETIAILSSDLPASHLKRIAGLGIAIPFQIWEWAEEIDVSPETMTAWKTFDIVSAVSSVCGTPVFLENDASAACGAELVFGQTARPSEFLYIYIGYFIGGGIVLDGSLYTGPSGNAGAVGAMPVMGHDGRMTQLLDIASLFQLERHLKAAGHDTSTLWSASEGWNTPAPIEEAWIA